MPASVVSSAAHGKKLADGMKKGEPMLVLFHAHWCPHCVDYIGNPPTASYPWRQVCNRVEDTYGDEVKIYEVESEQMKHLPAGMPQVQGFPTLMVYDGKAFHEFSGDRRDEKAVVAFIKSHGGGAAKQTKSGGAAKKKTETKKAGGEAKPVAKPAKKKTTKK